MVKKDKTIEKHYYNNTFIKYFTIALLTLITFLFIIQWINLNNNFNSFKIESQQQTSSLEILKTNLIDLKQVEKDSLNYVFKTADIENINKNLNVLAAEVYNERNKAEAIIDKDIDRLNLYMAIGIGFLALLGVFVPLLVNILSNNDLEKKLEELDSKYKSISKSTSQLEDQVQDLDSDKLKQAISNAREALEKSEEIEMLKNKTNLILPKLSVISLQIAIHRLFNQSSLALSESRDNANELFVILFSDIKDNLIKCKNNSLLLIQDNSNLQQTIADLAKLLQDNSFKYTSYIYSREIEIKAQQTIERLTLLSKCIKSNQEENYRDTFESLDKLIDEIKNTDV